jgi:TetR/AcrR family transcriptional regulator, transcriptional repressor for nem operon
MARPTGRPIREELVVVATQLIQTAGLGAFSYGALALEVGIKSPTIHHHFPKREQLIAAVVGQYRQDFAVRVASLGDQPADQKIVSYARLYSEVAKSGRMCLCGALAAEFALAGEDARSEVDSFFAEQLQWLQTQLRLAQKQGEIRESGIDVKITARVILAILQGSLLLARSDSASGHPEQLVREVIKGISIPIK